MEANILYLCWRTMREWWRTFLQSSIVVAVIFHPNNSSQFKRQRHHVNWNLRNPKFQNIFSETNVVKSQMLYVSLQFIMQTNHTTRRRLHPLFSISPQSSHQHLHLTFHIDACISDIILKYGSASRWSAPQFSLSSWFSGSLMWP